MSGLDASDAAPLAPVALGSVHFCITDPEASALAIASGALAEGESLVCLRAVFTPAEPGGATPRAGDVVALQDDDGLAVLFTVAIAHGGLRAPCGHDPGPGGVGHETLQPGEVLLVQLSSSLEEAQPCATQSLQGSEGPSGTCLA